MSGGVFSLKQKLVIGLISILVIVVVSNLLLQNNTKSGVTNEGTGIEKGDTPPQFELETLSGEQVQLADFKGKKVILNFWATWCKPCREEMPAFQAYSEQHEDVIVLAVNMSHKDSGIEKVKAFVKDNGLTFTVALDELGDVSRAYSVINIPSTYFLDEAGVIQTRVDGAVDEDKIAQYIEQM